MAQLTLKTSASLRQAPKRTSLIQRAVCALCAAAAPSDPVQEPRDLEYPMHPRARRLMRTGRVNGW